MNYKIPKPEDYAGDFPDRLLKAYAHTAADLDFLLMKLEAMIKTHEKHPGSGDVLMNGLKRYLEDHYGKKTITSTKGAL